jgi:hypothetical protein
METEQAATSARWLRSAYGRLSRTASRPGIDRYVHGLRE